MYLEIIALGIVALAAFAHYRAGIWAAALSLFAIVLAGAAAFGLFLPISKAMAGATSTFQFWGDGLVLLVVFWASFLFLRLVAEHLLKNAMPFRPVVDTLVGAAVGAVGGYLVAGVLAVFAQMMPMPPVVLGYGPFGRDQNEWAAQPLGQRRNHLSLRYDDAVLGLYDGLSGGALQRGDHDGDGNDTSLSAHYLAARPGAESAGARPFRGRGVDDILYYYFRRRMEFALRSSESAGAYSEGKGGIPLAMEKGKWKGGKFSPGRGAVPVVMAIQRAWATPALTWRNGQGGLESVRAEELEWEQPDGSWRKGTPAEAMLVVQVTFDPETKDPHEISLSDWYVESVFRETEVKGRQKYEEVRYPKLWGAAQAAGSGAAATLAPLEALLDAESVRAAAPSGTWKSAGGLKAGNALFVASEARWTFGGEGEEGGAKPRGGKARATLVFLVPSLSYPWQYGIKCGEKPEGTGIIRRGITLEDGVVPGLKEKIGALQVQVKKVDRRSSLAEVDRKAGEGMELMVVQMDLGKTDAAAALVTAKDVLLTNTVLKADYEGALLDEVAVKDGRKEAVRKLRNADVLVEGAEAVMEAEGAKGQMLSPAWEVYLLERSASAETTLVFEVPRGKPASQYRLKIPESLPGAAPEWYLMRNRKPARSATHTMSLAGQASLESIPLQGPDGSATEFKVPAASNAEMMVATLQVAPKKEDDAGYYEMKAGDIAGNVKIGTTRRDVPVFAVRPPGQEAFRRMKDDEVILIQGKVEISVAFYVTKEQEELRVTVRGLGSEVIKKER